MKNFFFTITLVMGTVPVFGQELKTVLAELYNQASIVVEVQIGSNESYLCSTDPERRPSVHTRHQTLVLKLIKSDVVDFNINQLKIVTKGGELEDREQSFTHSTQVTEGGVYLLFLVPVTQYLCPDKNDFQIMSLTGRVATDVTLMEDGENVLKDKVHIPRYGYHDKDDFYRMLSELAG